MAVQQVMGDGGKDTLVIISAGKRYTSQSFQYQERYHSCFSLEELGGQGVILQNQKKIMRGKIQQRPQEHAPLKCLAAPHPATCLPRAQERPEVAQTRNLLFQMCQSSPTQAQTSVSTVGLLNQNFPSKDTPIYDQLQIQLSLQQKNFTCVSIFLTLQSFLQLYHFAFCGSTC